MELENNKDLIYKIKKVKLPKKNIYYEKDSADGYAYLGYSYSKLNLEYTELLNIVYKKNLTLNSERFLDLTKYGMGKQKYYRETKYIYTYWTCFEFFKQINDIEKMIEINYNIDLIGKYKNGFVRYCDTEINYVVPNVSSAYALLKFYMGDMKGCMSIINILNKTQINGNWKYKIKKEDKFIEIDKYEDSCHLAMMVYHLRKIEKNSNIETKNLYLKSIESLKIMNEHKLQESSIGWGIPMLMLAVKDIDNDIYNRCYNIIDNYLYHDNFRVRSLTAFCLTMEY